MIYGDVLCYASGTILPELNHPDCREAPGHAGRRRPPRGAVRRAVHLRAGGPEAAPDSSGVPQSPGGRRRRGRRAAAGCSSSVPAAPTTLKFYEELFGNLFREVRAAGRGRADHLLRVVVSLPDVGSQTKTPCPRCREIPVHEMTARLVEAVDRGVQARLSRTPSPPSGSTPGGAATGARASGRWRRSIGLFHHIEKDYRYRKPGYTKSIWDYSIDYTGPSPEMQQLAAFAHQTGRPLLVKTETGIGLEVFQFPYVPAMQHLADKWQGVRSLQPAGVHQSWLFFGMAGTRAEELGVLGRL